MNTEAWGFASGVANARETAFLPRGFIEELAALPPAEVAPRLSRTWFGSADPLSEFDRLAQARRAQELDYFEKISPAGWPIDLIRLDSAADQIRFGLAEIPEAPAGSELAQPLLRLALRAGRFYDDFTRELQFAPPKSGVSARLAASLLIDSAELNIAMDIARSSEDEVLMSWAEARMRIGAARVAARAIRRGVPREGLAEFFFRGALLIEEARSLLADFREQAAQRLYPAGFKAGEENAFLREIVNASKGQPYSAAVVLRYFMGYLEQERLLRLSVYAALGKIPAKEAA